MTGKLVRAVVLEDSPEEVWMLCRCVTGNLYFGIRIMELWGQHFTKT